MVDQSTADESVQVAADSRTVDDAFRSASRALSATVANGYVRRIATSGGEEQPDLDLIQARAEVAALMHIDGVLGAVEDHADALTKQWLDRFRVRILALSEERQATYAEIRSQARTPEHSDTRIPEIVQEESKNPNGELYDTRPLHILSDEAGEYPIGGFNDWECSVIDTELARPHVVAWYRNPSQPTDHSIRVPYQAGGDWKSMQPDFVFVTQDDDGGLAASIVDPHSHHLSDALAKLQGLASFGAKHGESYQRIDALAKNTSGRIVLLDMKDAAVREAVENATSAAALFDAEQARTYL